jgi:hypothetical protein
MRAKCKNALISDNAATPEKVLRHFFSSLPKFLLLEDPSVYDVLNGIPKIGKRHFCEKKCKKA